MKNLLLISLMIVPILMVASIILLPIGIIGYIWTFEVFWIQLGITGLMVSFSGYITAAIMINILKD